MQVAAGQQQQQRQLCIGDRFVSDVVHTCDGVHCHRVSPTAAAAAEYCPSAHEV